MSEPASVAEVLAGRMADRLLLYRDLVARAARGEVLGDHDATNARRALRQIGLPLFAWRRDVRAYREAQTAQGHRRAELAWAHPHLFDDAGEWVAARRLAITLRHGGAR